MPKAKSKRRVVQGRGRGSRGRGRAAEGPRYRTRQQRALQLQAKLKTGNVSGPNQPSSSEQPGATGQCQPSSVSSPPHHELQHVPGQGEDDMECESWKPTQDSAKTASYACLEASCRKNLQIQTWMKTNFNVNAKYGGGTALVLMSRSGKSEVQLIRCGVDSNNWEATSLMLSGAHTYYHWHEVHTDDDGHLCPAIMFGDSHCCVLSNIATMGHCGCAVIFDAPAVGDGTSAVTSLGTVAESTGGCFLVICSAPSVKEGGNVYFIHHTGGSNCDLFAKPLSPDQPDLWQFEGSEGCMIAAKGPSESHYSVIHNFSEEFTSQHADKSIGKVFHTQAFDGTTPTKILTGCFKNFGRSVLLMCSCSSGTDEATTSALYQVTFQQKDIVVSYLSGSSGTFDNPSVWTISCTKDDLIVVGPPAPCRYAYISNIHEDISDPNDRCDQGDCLATGMSTPLDSGIELRDETLVGWVSRPVAVQIWLNSKVIERLDVDQLLEQPDGRLGFQREFTEDEMSPGLKLLRVYGLQQDIYNKAVSVELEGSPLKVENQPPGVMFAINLGGPVYEASNNIVYSDTQSLFTFDEVNGYQCNSRYSRNQSRIENLYSLMENTHDGFLYSTFISGEVEYDIPLSKGEYGLTVHSVGNNLHNQEIIINGKSYSSQVTEAVPEKDDVPTRLRAIYSTVPFSAEEGITTMHFKNVVCALMIFDIAKYKKPEQTQEDREKDALETQTLSDQLLPLDRTFLKKEMKFVGWSSNLLKNASGETGDVFGWNASGDWQVRNNGGDRTETHFVSSFMNCTKYQKIDLTQHFSEAYLDSCPEIQASESFREGYEHGGFYSLTVKLMNSDGQLVEKKTTNEKKITIAQRSWIRESFSFKDYSKGIRFIRFETTARDDKHWRGPFGALASAALLRVKSELKAAEDDEDADVVENTLSNDLLQDLTKIVCDINKDYRQQLDANQKPTDKEREAHKAFADVRKHVYIGREKYFKAIDEHFQHAANGQNEPLVIMGMPGSGKSALVANWCGRFVEKEPDAFLFMHFIGSSPESASHLNLLRRLYEKLCVYLPQDLVVPLTDQNLVSELPTWLKLASNRGNRVMLVLDALNQLDSGTGYSGEEQELQWLPKDLPPNVNLLMSTLPGKAKDVVNEIGWPTLQVHPLNYNEKREIITGYMSMYSKTLNEEQLSIVVEADQTNNPLYLKKLLDEICMLDSCGQLTDTIKNYLDAKDPKKLFVKVLEQLELDFESSAAARRGLVRDTTVAIWCSHSGMSEQELLNYLKVPPSIWSPFYLSLQEHLVNRNGIVNFCHDNMRQAVEIKYLSTEGKKRVGYSTLANFFSGENIDDRYVKELPYLLAKAGERNRLIATVLNIAVFQRLMNTEEGKYQLFKSWQLLGGYHQIEEAYMGVLNRSDWKTVVDKASLMWSMARFFMQLGFLTRAKLLLNSLLKELEEHYIDSHGVIVYHHCNNSFKRRCNHPDVLDVLIEIGVVCQKLDMLADAYKHFSDALSRQQKPNKPAEKLRLVKTLMGLGSIDRLRGKPRESKRFLARSREVATEVLDLNHHYVASIIGQLGELSHSEGALKNAIPYYLKDLKLTQTEVGFNHPRTAAILNNIALVLDDCNNGTAGTIFKAVLAILVEAYGKDYVDVAVVRLNLGTFFLATNYYHRASFQYQEALRVFTAFLGEEHPHTISTATAIEKLKDLKK